MGLLVECPECKRRNNLKVKACKCGFALAKFSGRVWWIEYYDPDKRLRRERIGPNKAAAEQRYREVMSARTEGRFIKKSPDARTLFKDLAAWYLDLPEVKVKRSYNTVNRELACLKTIFSKAMKNGKAESNPAQGVKLLKENNERDRILSPEEYTRLLAQCSPHLKQIVKVAYHTGMRQGEIINLTWGQVDLKEGFIRLHPEDTKTNEGRLVPLTGELVGMFKAMPRGLPGVNVFTFKGRSIQACPVAFCLCRGPGH